MESAEASRLELISSRRGSFRDAETGSAVEHYPRQRSSSRDVSAAASSALEFSPRQRSSSRDLAAASGSAYEFPSRQRSSRDPAVAPGGTPPFTARQRSSSRDFAAAASETASELAQRAWKDAAASKSADQPYMRARAASEYSLRSVSTVDSVTRSKASPRNIIISRVPTRYGLVDPRTGKVYSKTIVSKHSPDWFKSYFESNRDYFEDRGIAERLRSASPRVSPQKMEEVAGADKSLATRVLYSGKTIQYEPGKSPALLDYAVSPDYISSSRMHFERPQQVATPSSSIYTQPAGDFSTDRGFGKRTEVMNKDTRAFGHKSISSPNAPAWMKSQYSGVSQDYLEKVGYAGQLKALCEARVRSMSPVAQAKIRNEQDAHNSTFFENSDKYISVSIPERALHRRNQGKRCNFSPRGRFAPHLRYMTSHDTPTWMDTPERTAVAPHLTVQVNRPRRQSKISASINATTPARKHVRTFPGED
mmetsp:Transcript_19841/g.32878  ORF Transcript_19841/g.32878 Transcript_19841/m.32878 type:complete len:478 (+) Transcript_19841:2-1435(+)